MGDRVTVYLNLYGKVAKSHAEALLPLLKEHDFRVSETYDEPDIRTMGESLVCHEVNYGDISDIVDCCWDYGIAFEYFHPAGDGFAARIYRYDGEKLRESGYDDGPMLSYREVLEVETLVTGMASLIESARFWLKELSAFELVDDAP